MKRILSYFTASCLGVLTALTLIILLFVLVAAFSGGGGEGIAADSVLVLDLSEPISEKTNNIAISMYDPASSSSIGLRHFQRLMEEAASDKRIKSMLIKNSGVSTGLATIHSLRASIDTFKRSGKKVYAYADYMSQGAYFLAGAADSIFLNPNGSIDLKGFGTIVPYYKEIMDKYGVEMDVFYAGEFKSATESYRLTSMSAENRFQLQEFMNDAFSHFSGQIAMDRGLDKNVVNEAASSLDLRNPQICKDLGFIDGIVYWDEMEELIRKGLDLKNDKKINYVDLVDYKEDVVLIEKGKMDNKIAILYLEGEISYGNGKTGIIDDTRYLPILKKIRNDDKIKSVILRVNSPGGSALTSDLIWHEVEKLKERGKKVIASYGDYAASGGYYISCSADTIIAMPSTLTGSIGVFSTYPNLSRFLDKNGIDFDTVKTHPYAVSFSPMYDISPDEESIIHEQTQRIYDLFTKRVAEGRNLPLDQVYEIAKGRIYSGLDALEVGLVDEIGTLDDAIDMASDYMGTKEYRIVEYPKIKENLFKKILSTALSDNMAKTTFDESTKTALMKFEDFERKISTKGPQARMPYEVRLK